MKRRNFLLLSLASGLAACGDSDKQTTTGSSSGKELAEQLRKADLPANSPEIGTAIKDVVKPAADTEVVSELKGTVKQIMWDDLVPDDFKPESIMQKYQAEIQNTPEGSPEERVLMKKLMAEFDNAPTNVKLNGVTVRIPGFVSPLDQNDGVISEFLLVPFFGSCIHKPPPPVNQTVLVKPQEGKSIYLDQIYDPVWVTGLMKVEATTTTLAQAGYLIEGAQLEKYTGEGEGEGQEGEAGEG